MLPSGSRSLVGLRSSDVALDPIPISLVAHTVFCPRRAWLEALGEQVDSFAIQSGTEAHRQVDDPGSSRPLTLRSVDLNHSSLGLVGRCDVVRGDLATQVEIIEYKATPVRRKPEIRPAHRVQLALQRMCLEDMGVAVASQGVYFTSHKVMQPVHLEPDDMVDAFRWVETTRQVISQDAAPEPLVDDPRCAACSHAEVCLPDEHHLRSPSRSISVTNPDAEIVHLVTPGSRASLKGGRLIVEKGADVLASIPFERVLGLVVHGNVDLSSALVRECLWSRHSIVWCSGRGRVIGWASTADSPAGITRVRQHVRSFSGDLPIAREMLAAKVSNQATQLRRNNPGAGTGVVKMRALARRMLACGSIPELFGIEGEAASIYFSQFEGLVKASGGWAFETWPGRRGRRATDPLNAALNYCYGLLLADAIRALVACGLDPSAGFAHSASRNKPALALDLMEEFRAPIADSAVITALNNGELSGSMFLESLGDARLSAVGRRVLTGVYERRLQTEIRHPVFGYRVTWRRCIEVQARLLRGTLDGSQPAYTGMRTR